MCRGAVADARINITISRTTGSYQLDNGDGPEPHTDDVHTITFTGHPSADWCGGSGGVGSNVSGGGGRAVGSNGKGGDIDGPTIVVATGNNEFGPFISAGVRTPPSAADGEGNLTLARRYIDEADLRCGWSAVDLIDKILDPHGAAGAAVATALSTTAHAPASALPDDIVTAAAAAALAATSVDGSNEEPALLPWNMPLLAATLLRKKSSKKRKSSDSTDNGWLMSVDKRMMELRSTRLKPANSTPTLAKVTPAVP
jgi:hypothetical protein